MLTIRTNPDTPTTKHFIWSGPNKEDPVEIAVYDSRDKTLVVNSACLDGSDPALPMERRMEQSTFAKAWAMVIEVFPDIFANPPMERAFPVKSES